MRTELEAISKRFIIPMMMVQSTGIGQQMVILKMRRRCDMIVKFYPWFASDADISAPEYISNQLRAYITDNNLDSDQKLYVGLTFNRDDVRLFVYEYCKGRFSDDWHDPEFDEIVQIRLIMTDYDVQSTIENIWRGLQSL